MMAPLDEGQRQNITVSELARLIFRLKRAQKGVIDLPNLLKILCPQNEQNIIKDHPNLEFTRKFYEAIGWLKHRGLLMDVTEVGYALTRETRVHPTSIWERSFLDNDGMIILIDEAQDIVNSLKEEVPNLDSIVEQYYLESLRACQESLYVSSVISLGVASERTIDCLKEAVVTCYPEHKILERRWVSDSIKYILKKFKDIFSPIIDTQLRVDLKEQLDLMEKIYRLNRNEAGHPKPVPMNITRCGQENYLNAFRRYVVTIFKVMDVLNPDP